MPSVKSSAFKRFTYCFKLVVVILLFSKIILTYLHCAKKGLVYIIIIALFSCQPFSYIECTKLNIHSSCNIYLVSNTKYTFPIYLCLF